MTQQSRNARLQDLEEPPSPPPHPSHTSHLPITFKKPSSYKPTENYSKSPTRSDHSNDSSRLFSNFLSKSKNHANLTEGHSSDDRRSIISTSPGEPSLLQRSITVGNRSLSKMKSLSNFRSPESMASQTLHREAMSNPSPLTRAGTINPVPQITVHQIESPQSPEEKDKLGSKKVRSARSEFFNSSTKTISSMIPKMDKLNPFTKLPSKGHKQSRSATDNMTSPNSDTQATSLSFNDFTEDQDKDSDKEFFRESDEAELDFETTSVSNSELTDTDSFIYGALLSEISFNFYKLLVNQGQFAWPKVFTGMEAIDHLCSILEINDRKLALLIGRAFSAQNFITHTSLDLDLADNAYETYKLDDHLQPIDTLSDDELQEALPNGVFTLLTACYSPTCSPRNQCYCVSCPRRFENIPEELIKGESVQTPHEPAAKEQLWESFVTSDILASVSDRERKRQEVIFELIYTERDFVSDLKIIQELYLIPLTSGDIIPEGEQRESFLREVFINILDIQLSSFELSSGLLQIQSKTPVIECIGQFFLEHINCFGPFKDYGANQVYSKRRLAAEIKKSPELEEFLKNQARYPECRKLPIQSFLARPTTRLGRYPLLLEAILKYTEEGNPDIENIPKVIAAIKEVLSEINVRAGAADNRVKIDDIFLHLSGSSDSIKELGLTDENRILVRDGVFKKKSGVDFVEVNVFLFDTHFLMTKKRKSTKNLENFEYKISKKPIKLDLLVLSDQEHVLSRPGAATNAMPLVTMETHKTTSFPLTITHLGRQGGTYVLYCSTLTEKERWKSIILEQREKVLQQTMVFMAQPLADKTTCPITTVLSSAIYESEHILLLGGDGGIYAKNFAARSFKLVVELDKVKKIEILEENDLILILSDRTLYTLPLDLALSDARETKLVPEKLKSNIDFFSIGTCLGKTLVCAIKTTALSTTGRLYQPTNAPKKTIHTPKSFLTSIGAKKPLEFFKEFYIPSESFNVYFLKSKLCVACAKGFEILDLASLLPQGLLNPADPNLEFVFTRGETVKPIAFFRIRDGVFFVCYDEFGFFVDRAGQLETSTSILYWKGHPKSFSMVYPYILAFDPNFIEVRSLESGELKQVLHTEHNVTLRTGTDAIHYVEQTHALESWILQEMYVNRAHPSNISFRRTQKDARTSKRKGMIGSYSTT